MTAAQNPLARSSPALVSQARLLKQWTREVLHLRVEDIVSVNELSCALPDCPPRETVIFILAATGCNRQFSIHKALVDVDRDDIVRTVAANPVETLSAIASGA